MRPVDLGYTNMESPRDQTIRLMLVEDHEPTRRQMVKLIEREPDLQVVAEVGCGEDALARMDGVRPDVIVMDILLPGLTGLDTSRVVLAQWPAARILVLSNYSGQALVQAVLEAGVLGYVRKDRAFEELLPAIRCVAARQRYLGEEIKDA